MKNLLTFTTVFCALVAHTQTFTTYTEADGLLDDTVLSVCVDSNDDVWFGCQEGISMYDGNTWTNYTMDDGLIFNTVKAIYVDDEGKMWAGTDLGISHMLDGTWGELTTNDGLEDNKINCISEDSQGLMWFGHADGASSYDGSEFTNYTMDDGLPFGGVKSIAEDEDGNIWMGTGLGGCFIWNGSSFTEINEDGDLISDGVRDVEIRNGTKWVATNIGLSVFDESDMHVADHDSVFTLPEPHEINPIEDVKIDSQGRVWAGVYVDYLVTVGGVSLYLGGEWYDYTEDDGLAGPNVGELALTSDDMVWVATTGGVTLIGDVPTGVESVPLGSAQSTMGLMIYPNPASDWVTISGLTDDAALFDLNGRKVKDIKASALTQIWVGDLESGVYFVKQGAFAKRFIVK